MISPEVRMCCLPVLVSLSRIEVGGDRFRRVGLAGLERGRGGQVSLRSSGERWACLQQQEEGGKRAQEDGR